MIGISVSDILKVLDQVPGWKAVMGLPKRVKELEERVAALEAKPAAKPAEACPICGEAMKVVAVKRPRDAAQDRLGFQQHEMACTVCNHTERRMVMPGGTTSG